MTGHGKRSSPRINRRLTVRFGPKGTEHLGFTIDISADGLFIGAATVYKSGGILYVQIATNTGETVLLKAEIRWAKKMPVQYAHKVKSGMGLRIIEIIEGREVYAALCAKS